MKDIMKIEPLTDEEIAKLRIILTEEWVLSKWLEKMKEFDKVFIDMVKILTKIKKDIKKLEEKIK